MICVSICGQAKWVWFDMILNKSKALEQIWSLISYYGVIIQIIDRQKNVFCLVDLCVFSLSIPRAFERLKSCRATSLALPIARHVSSKSIL